MQVEIPVEAKHCLRQTCVNNSYVISTIKRQEELAEFDGLIEMLGELIGDVGRADLGTPGEWETMVFPGNDEDGITDWGELDFARYESEDDAHDGHIEMVAKWEDMPSGMARDSDVRLGT